MITSEGSSKGRKASLWNTSFEGRENVKKSLKFLVLGVAVLVMGAIWLAAQDPVVGSKDPESLFTSKDAKLNTNKQAAMHIMRDLLEAGHWDRSEERRVGKE